MIAGLSIGGFGLILFAFSVLATATGAYTISMAVVIVGLVITNIAFLLR